MTLRVRFTEPRWHVVSRYQSDFWSAVTMACTPSPTSMSKVNLLQHKPTLTISHFFFMSTDPHYLLTVQAWCPVCAIPSNCFETRFAFFTGRITNCFAMLHPAVVWYPIWPPNWHFQNYLQPVTIFTFQHYVLFPMYPIFTLDDKLSVIIAICNTKEQNLELDQVKQKTEKSNTNARCGSILFVTHNFPKILYTYILRVLQSLPEVSIG